MRSRKLNLSCQKNSLRELLVGSVSVITTYAQTMGTLLMGLEEVRVWAMLTDLPPAAAILFEDGGWACVNLNKPRLHTQSPCISRGFLFLKSLSNHKKVI